MQTLARTPCRKSDGLYQFPFLSCGLGNTKRQISGPRPQASWFNVAHCSVSVQRGGPPHGFSLLLSNLRPADQRCATPPAQPIDPVRRQDHSLLPLGWIAASVSRLSPMRGWSRINPIVLLEMEGWGKSRVEIARKGQSAASS